ncbi:uncharacterized protein LOC141641422 [Silene latifolia]|uniref:uncharacterized protein LOC141641422 n=1 Tax=Silene latifolia TaxID=37657 RepID=UPI003D77CD9A
MNTNTKKVGAYDWSSMPHELVSNVFDNLDNNDVARRRASSLCTTWRRCVSHVFPKAPTPPSITKLPYICTCGLFNNNVEYCRCEDIKYYSLVRRTRYYFIVSPGSQTNDSVWLIRAEDVGPNKWLLHNPCSWKDDYQESSSPFNQFSFNLLDEYRIFDVANLYTLHHAFDLENSPCRKNNTSTIEHRMPFVHKLIPFPDWSRFLLLFGKSRRLALFSESNHQWTFVDTG